MRGLRVRAEEAALTTADRGTKRRCPNCGTAYYDLGRSPVTCPKCQALFVETPRVPLRAPSRSRIQSPAPAEEPMDEATVFDEDETADGDELEPDAVADEDQEDETGEDRE